MPRARPTIAEKAERAALDHFRLQTSNHYSSLLLEKILFKVDKAEGAKFPIQSKMELNTKVSPSLGMKLAMTVVPNNEGNHYAAVKKKCYLEKPIPSQVVTFTYPHISLGNSVKKLVKTGRYQNPF